MSRKVGIDPSTHIGLAVLDDNDSVICTRGFDLKGIKTYEGFARSQVLARGVGNFVDEWVTPGTVIVIEGYVLHTKASIALLCEIGTLIRLELFERKLPWWEVPPSTLKKFVTGKGNADKKAMAQAVQERWNFYSANHDIVDAFALAKCGGALSDGKLLLKGVNYEGQ